LPLSAAIPDKETISASTNISPPFKPFPTSHI
jgi:hypothetical protein